MKIHTNIDILNLGFKVSPFGLPKSSGVYLICLKKEFKTRTDKIHRVLYVGSSKNMNKRVYSPNHIYRKVYDRGWMVYCAFLQTEDYISLEKTLIKELRPLLNKQHK